jgi:hypothetical protein
MLLRCRKLMDGPGPSESVIEITVDGGTEELVVHNNALKGDAIEIGSVIGERAGLSLVELPRESASGKWRVWVPTQEIRQTA